MPTPEPDRDLLLGHIAVELNFINAITFAAAKEAWQAQKNKSMGQVLVDRQAISPHTRDVLENLVQLQLAQDGSEEDASGTGDHEATTLGIVDDLIPAPPPLTDASFTGPLANASAFRFRRLKPHAAGALGQVYVARDRELHRKVALKEIQDRYADQPDSRSRFLLEAEITGRLEHPGVVPVYGLGRYQNGRPFYAMRFIKGESLADAIKILHSPENAERDPGERMLELRKLLGRFVDVCNTMQYAHDRKIVHRDLKPGNIMLGAYGETLVVDWGLAKVIGGALISDPSGSLFEPLPSSGSSETLPGRAIGTITYMSPEQAAGRIEQVGPASDVYSLGATLFTLLTGRPSIEDSLSPDQKRVDLRKLQKKVINGTVHRPRDLKPDVDPALEAVCMKAMANKIEDRYLSARALADDLECWLGNEPVSAWPEPLTVRTRRWLDGHRTLVSGIAAALVVGLVSLAAATLLLNDERHKLTDQIAKTEAAHEARIAALKKAKEEREEAVKQRAEADKRRAEAVQARDEADKARENLDGANKKLKTVNVILNTANEKLRISEANLKKASSAAIAAREAAEKAADLEKKARDRADQAAEFEKKARERADQTLALNTTMLAQSRWNEGQVVQAHDALEQVPPKYRFAGWHFLRRQFEGSYATLYGHTDAVRRVVFSPDGRLLVSVSKDGKAIAWDARTGRNLRSFAGITAIAFSPDSKRLAAGAKDGTVKLIDPANGALIKAAKLHDEGVTSLAYSPDGRRLFSAAQDGKLKASEASTLANVAPLFKKAHATGVTALAFSPDGKRLASTSLDKTLIIWDASAGVELQVFIRRTNGVAGAAFSPDGRLLAVADPDESVRLYRADTGEEIGFAGRHSAGITSVLFSPDGQRLASASWDGSAKVWDLDATKEPLLLQGHAKEVLGISFSPDGQRLASASADWTVKLWDLVGGGELRTFTGQLASVSSIAYSPGAKERLASGTWNGTVTVWNPRTGAAIWSLKAHPAEVLSVAFNSDGTRLASAGQDGKIKLWDADTGKEIATPIKGHNAAVTGLAFSTDGKRLASASKDKSVLVWDLASGAAVRTFMDGDVTGVAFSPDGATLAWADRAGAVKIGDLATGKTLLSIDAHSSGITRVAFSPDGACLTSAGQDGRVNLWDPRKTPPLLLSLKGHAGGVMDIAYSSDGKRLASASKDGTVKIWDARTGQDLQTLHGHSDLVTSVAFSPDGTRVASASLDKTVKLWDSRTALPLLTFKGKRAKAVKSVAFSKDGKRIESRDELDHRLIWDAATGDLLPGQAVQAVEFTASPISPDGKKLALPYSTWFYVINLDPSPEELQGRLDMSRLKPWWHQARARHFEKEQRWYAAAFHWGFAVSAFANEPKLGLHLDDACRQLPFEQLFRFAQAQQRLGNSAVARRFFDQARLPAGASEERRQLFETLRRSAAAALGLKLAP